MEINESFSCDEGYQALCSPRLIEQESYIANFVACIPLVSAVLSGVWPSRLWYGEISGSIIIPFVVFIIPNFQ